MHRPAWRHPRSWDRAFRKGVSIIRLEEAGQMLRKNKNDAEIGINVEDRSIDDTVQKAHVWIAQDVHPMALNDEGVRKDATATSETSRPPGKFVRGDKPGEQEAGDSGAHGRRCSHDHTAQEDQRHLVIGQNPPEIIEREMNLLARPPLAYAAKHESCHWIKYGKQISRTGRLQTAVERQERRTRRSLHFARLEARHESSPLNLPAELEHLLHRAVVVLP